MNYPVLDILYVDDDVDDIEFVTRAFSRTVNNVNLVVRNDGLQALEFLEERASIDLPCLIILDINMPRMGGKETLKEIRTDDRFDEIPVVFFTTSSYDADILFARQYRAGFITKPIDNRQMISIVDKFLEFCASGLPFDKKIVN